MNNVLLVAAGGSLGALLRFWLGFAVQSCVGREFPYGTLVVNTLGCFLMGFLSEFVLQRVSYSAEFRALILIGMLGAFTTYSSFAIESLYLVELGHAWKAIANVLLTVLLCMLAVWAGVLIGRHCFNASDWTAYSGTALTLAGCALVVFLAGLGCESSRVRPEWTETARFALAFTFMTSAVIISTAITFRHLPSDSGTLLHTLPLLFSLYAVGAGLALWLGIAVGRQC